MGAIRQTGDDSDRTKLTEEPNNRQTSVNSVPPANANADIRRTSRFSISRPIFSQAKFDDNNESAEHGQPATPWTKLKRNIARRIYSTFHSRTSCSRVTKKKLFRTFPILRWLPRYDVKQNLLKDLVAGLTVGIMNIPQGMAYGKLAAVPHVYGLYTSFFPLLMYTLMGTSRHVSVGTFAVVSLMTSKIVISHEHSHAEVLQARGINLTSTPDSEGQEANVAARVGVLITVAFCVGIWQMLLGLMGLGSLTVYLSDQLVKGFTSGAAVHVFTSQLKSVFGLRNMTSYYGPFKLIYTYRDFFGNIHRTHVPTLVISIICLVSLLLIKYLINENKRIMKFVRFPIPAELLVVICGAVTSWCMGLGDKYSVATVRKVPTGIPNPQVPEMSLVPTIITDCLPIAVVGFAITVSLGKLFAQRFKYEIDPSQELKALGTTNIVCSFFQCIPATGSLARSAVQVAVGGMTQVVSIIAAVFVFVVIQWLGHLLEPLPEACLGAIIMVALINMIKQISELGKLWQISFVDTSVLLVAFLSVLLFDVDIGLGIGVGYSLLTVIMRTQRPELGLLGRVPQTDIYKRLDSYRTALEIPNVKIIRLDAPLYFANAEYFRRTTYELCGLDSLLSSQEEERIMRPDTRYSSTDRSKYQVWNDHEVDPSVSIIQHDTPDSSPANSPVPLVEISNNSDKSVFLSGFKIHHLICDCSAVCYIDVAGVELLEKMEQELRSAGIELLLASCKVATRETLALSGFEKKVGLDHLFLSVHDAVLFALKPSVRKISNIGEEPT